MNDVNRASRWKDAVRDGVHGAVRAAHAEPMLAWLTQRARVPVQEAVFRRVCPPPHAYAASERRVVSRHGLRLELGPRDYFQWHHYYGFHDEVLSLLVDCARSAIVAIDVGANIGLYALAVGRAMPAGGRVLAIEPSPSTMDRLCRHVALNHASNVEPLALALSDRPGEAMLRDFGDGEPGKASLRHAPGADVARVRVDTIDALLSDRGIERCDLIKIDVEGLEPEVLLGATRTIRERRPTICFEWTPTWLADRWDRVERMVDLLQEARYDLGSVHAVATGYEIAPLPLDSLRSPDVGVSARNLVARPSESLRGSRG